MEELIKVLFVEDTIADTELLIREMRRGGLEILAQRVDTREGLEKALEQFAAEDGSVALPGRAWVVKAKAG